MNIVEKVDVEEAFRRAAGRARGEGLSRNAIAIESLPSLPGFYAGADSDGAWCLVMEAVQSSARPPAVRLELLSAEFDVWYVLDMPGERRARVSNISCRSLDEVIRGLFVGLVCDIITNLPQVPSTSDVSAEVNKWLTLFRRLEQPAQTDVVGLIGELVLLYVATDADLWVGGWHIREKDLLDFNFPKLGCSVEVKATRATVRRHEVSLAQVSAGSGRQAFFASVLVELRGGGTSVETVALEIASRLGSEQTRRKFWETISLVGGVHFAAMCKEEFVLAYSVSSLQLFRAEDIPGLSMVLPLPLGVSDVRYKSDFSGAPYMSFGAFERAHDGVGG